MASNKEVHQIEIDVVPGDLIPKDLIQRTMKKVDTTDVDDLLQDNNDPSIVRIKNSWFSLKLMKKIKKIARNGKKKEGKTCEKSAQQ